MVREEKKGGGGNKKGGGLQVRQVVIGRCFVFVERQQFLLQNHCVSGGQMTCRAQTVFGTLQTLTFFFLPSNEGGRWNDDSIAVVGIEHTIFSLFPQKEAS